ncbi:MAG: hypothetical protein QW267_01915 [Sulfolobales archaeon]
MTRGRVVRVVCHYRDASILENLVSTFRKLLVDIEWFYGRMVDENGLYEVYLGVRESRNFLTAVLDLSTTINVQSVEVFDKADFSSHPSVDGGGTAEVVKIYIPRGSKSECYSWGEKCG